MSVRLPAAILTSGAVSLAGYRARALTGRGAIAATIVGSLAISRAGAGAALMLGAFFGSGSILTRLTPRIQTVGSSGERDERQVLANGGPAAVAAGLSGVLGPERAFVMLAGSIAAATADTWATELGSTSASAPRLILSRAEVPPGVSGGITSRGNIGALAGAVVIGSIAGLVSRSTRVGVIAAVAGVAGATLDSVLGEAIQVRRRDPASGALTEAAVVDGVPACYYSGWVWVDNDVVNVACTACGAGIALALHELAGGRDGRPLLAKGSREPPVGHAAD